MEVNVTQFKAILRKAIQSQFKTGRKKTILLTGSPGIGKTEVVREIAAAFQAKSYAFVDICPTQVFFMDHRQSSVIDGKLVWAYDDLIPFDRPVVLLVDEFCDLPAHEAAVWNRLVYEHCWGDRQLAAGSVVIAAGNRPEHGASADVPPAQSINRLMELRIVGDLEQWLTDFALPANLSPVVVAFLRFVKESESIDLIRDGWKHTEIGQNFVSARSATMLADYAEQDYNENDLPAAIGYFGNEYGLKFHAFATLQDCDPQTVLANPDSCPIPSAIDKRLLLLALLAAVATPQNVGEILKFSNRLDPGYSLGLFEDIARRLPSLKETAHWCRIIKQHPELI